MTSIRERLRALECPDAGVVLPDPGPAADRVALLEDARRKHPNRKVGFRLPTSGDPDDFI